ncbi:hypothetical protein SASPL_118066 [Salvia splendens]|uniref:Uncharacterized protein n=1 Tax=Salvia splendens TaxID=180675 RepID=A0A8X8XX06_SALSN|nr:hypothetical protein SASPL_118066 [Salvia splendens]
MFGCRVIRAFHLGLQTEQFTNPNPTLLLPLPPLHHQNRRHRRHCRGLRRQRRLRQNIRPRVSTRRRRSKQPLCSLRLAVCGADRNTVLMPRRALPQLSDLGSSCQKIWKDRIKTEKSTEIGEADFGELTGEARNDGGRI